MTLRSLYRLERRELLTCPIVGVAVDDWTVDDLRERARNAIVDGGDELDDEVFKRFADRLAHFARMAPYNWFNLYDFWEIPSDPNLSASPAAAAEPGSAGPQP